MNVKLVETRNLKKIPKILREKSKVVKELTPELLDLAAQMIAIMDKNKGIGISAVQVGVPIQMIVAKDCDKNFIFFNPEITSFSRREVVYNEGCLSFPDLFYDIERPERVKVKAMNENWEEVDVIAEGIFARVLQHEIDHLGGVLFVDFAE